MTAPSTRFEAERPRLERLAYRMLGTRGDAEDIVQDTYLRWKQANVEPENLSAWLTRTCVRLCLDTLKSARRKRETYVGPWLPEPWIDAEQATTAELDESLSMAVLALLERLKPTERAAFVLHDILGYEFGEVAQILGKAPAHCRQLAVRARAHLRRDRPRFDVDRAHYDAIARSFFAAIRGGDIAELRELLAQDVVFQSDGGGKAIAARRPIVGIDRVARFLDRTLGRANDVVTTTLTFNGSLGLVVLQAGSPITAIQVEIRDDKIASVFAVRNPDKLRGIAQWLTDGPAQHLDA